MKLPKELMTVTPLSKALALLLFITLPVVAFVFGMNYQNIIDNLDVSLNQEKGCTLDARICPDGSVVGRTGPNCEFAPCPTITTEEKNLGTMCGGIANIGCPEGYICSRRGKNYPDASGTCVKVGKDIKEIYTCSETSYVDCMPGTYMMKTECTAGYLQWAKENCPGFQGAAY